MRVDDRPPPLLDIYDAPTISHWPVRPVIAIHDPIAPPLWDSTAIWDDPSATFMWDGDPFNYTDATCWWQGLEIDTGEPDEANNLPAARLVLQLDNSDGHWSGLDADGTQSQFGPGTPIDVFAIENGVGVDLRGFGDLDFGDGDFGDAFSRWWLFSGFVARWDQRADNSIEVEAFDVFSDLAQPIGTYTPGTAGQQPGARLESILAVAGLSAYPHRFATGIVTLTAQETDQSPLEEMQVVVGSDGGLIGVDADGTLLSFDRNWRAGRADQLDVPVLSDNVCSAPIVIWDAVITTNDRALADAVILENLTELRSQAGSLPGYVMSAVEQQWSTQEQADALSALLLNDLSPRRIALEDFDLYLLDPRQPELWRAVDWRRLDRLRFVHDSLTTAGTTIRLDVTMQLATIVHTIVPDSGWVMTIGTTRAIDFRAPVLYDTGALYDTGEEYGF